MPDNQLNNEFEEFSYSLGLTISSNLLQSGVKKIDFLQFMAGLEDTFSGNKAKLSLEKANEILQEFMIQQNDKESIKNLEDGYSFLMENATKPGVHETDSGLQYKILRDGYGNKPTMDDVVKCHYHGTLLDGTVFDSSVERDQAALFPINGVILGWSEALQMMSVGSKWRLFVPSHLAYGPEGSGGIIGSNATLIFDVELLEIA